MLKLLPLFAFLAFVNYLVVAQQAAPDMTIDSATRAAIIDNLINELNRGYVFPEVAKKLEADVRMRQAAKEYGAITSAQAFTKKLTDDLQAISKDKHLRVRFSQQPSPFVSSATNLQRSRRSKTDGSRDASTSASNGLSE